MSYDAYIIIDTGGREMAYVETIGNYTSNVSPMYNAAIPEPIPGGGKYGGVGESEPREGLPGLSGLLCSEALYHIKKAIDYMESHAIEMRQLNPSNGWGDYEGALDYLEQCRAACRNHPKAIFAVSW